MPLALPDLRIAGETHEAYAARMKSLEQEVLALLRAAQRDRKDALDRGRVDTGYSLHALNIKSYLQAIQFSVGVKLNLQAIQFSVGVKLDLQAIQFFVGMKLDLQAI